MKLNWIVLGSRIGILPLLLLTILASSAAAQNCKYDVTGDWTLQQENGITVKLSLRLADKKVTGSASFQGTKQGHGHIEIGKVAGVFQKEGQFKMVFRIEIKWEYGETGVYRGFLEERCPDNKCNGARRIRGDAHIAEDATNQDRKTSWKILQDIPCVPTK